MVRKLMTTKISRDSVMEKELDDIVMNDEGFNVESSDLVCSFQASCSRAEQKVREVHAEEYRNAVISLYQKWGSLFQPRPAHR
jgi:hypothetical protein